MQLIIGTKNYSSWSLRPWLLLQHYAIPFEEIKIALFTEGFKDELAKYSPTLRVPVLKDGETTIWDSLAICEFVSDKYLQGRALPKSVEDRGLCRAYCSEMHSGFFAIRNEMPMNCRALRRLELSDEAVAECKRVDQLFSEARAQFAAQGEYLFGKFSIADCMFAPVVTRFHSYGVALSEAGQEYMHFMLKNPALASWLEQAKQETQILADYELGTPLTP